MSPNHQALARAIDAAKPKTQAGLAKAIGTSQALVGYWLNKSKRGVPAEWVLPIERVTGVPRHELRPDLYPPPDGAPADFDTKPRTPSPAACEAA